MTKAMELERKRDKLKSRSSSEYPYNNPHHSVIRKSPPLNPRRTYDPYQSGPGDIENDIAHYCDPVV